MAPLNKFPFKAMVPIMNFLNEQGFDSVNGVYDVQDASGACYSDTTEILEMLSYITSFGQVQQQANGWIIANKQQEITKKLFRDFYLTEIVTILSTLGKDTQTIENISVAAEKVGKKDIISYLEFLKTLTHYGFVKKTEKGWKLEKYQPFPVVEA